MKRVASTLIIVLALPAMAAKQPTPTTPAGAFGTTLSAAAEARLVTYLGHAVARTQMLTTADVQGLTHVTDAKGNLIAIKRAASNAEQETWALKDAAKDGVEGTSTEKAYAELGLKAPAEPVVVAVIDSGVDTKHEDLAGQTRDDGWNFLGNGKTGANVGATTLEVTRELVRLKKKKAASGLTPEETKYFAKVEADYNTQAAKKKATYAQYQQILVELTTAVEVLKAAGLAAETVEAIEAIASTETKIVKAKQVAVFYIKQGATTGSLKASIESLKTAVEFYFNEQFDSSAIVGDDAAKLDEAGYGNSDVKALDSDHGTHVSGIIGAVRGNGIGINGQAQWVKILPVRAVPDGDERDKDVANAVIYAVNHGAKIINMSFGKPYSPDKAYVDAAFIYAESKGVLVVHAAGNDSKNTETADNFPNKHIQATAEGKPRDLTNWLEIGASSAKKGTSLPARFSNFGKTSVDLFAPGVAIMSTTPDNTYSSFQGTSMASPEVAGVAALVLSQFPGLSVTELKAALIGGVVKYEGLQVFKPGAQTLIPFTDLSVTGGVVNAFNSLKIAAGVTKAPVQQ